MADVLPEVAEVARSLPVEQRAITVGALVALAWHYVDDEWARALLEIMNMPNMLDTMLDDAITRGLQQGLQQGREEGKVEGEYEGKRAALRAFVRAHFGSIPTSLEQRIAAADTATLDALIARVATAEKVDDL